MDIKDRAIAVGRYLFSALRWLALAVALGCLCGLLGAGFHRCIDLATTFRQGHPWLLLLLPLGGVATLLLYRLCRVSFDAGTNLIITSVASNADVPLLLAPLIVVGTTLSHLLGASVGVLRYGALLPCLAASYCAHLVALALGAEPMAFALTGQSALSAGGLARVALLAALCAAVSILLCVALEGGGHLAKKYLKNPYLRIALGGAVMAALVAGLGLYDYAGAGTQVIHRAMAGSADPWAFLLKIALTALCVAAGYRGGEIVPTLFVGATFGCVAAPLVGLDPAFGAAIGMIALFCSVVNCPLASLFLAAELFATADLTPFAVAVAVAFVLSGYFGLYSSQVMAFSKVENRPRDGE